MMIESASHNKKGKREYLSDSETRVEVKRIRNGEHQILVTLINEETILSARARRRRGMGTIFGRRRWSCHSPVQQFGARAHGVWL